MLLDFVYLPLEVRGHHEAVLFSVENEVSAKPVPFPYLQPCITIAWREVYRGF